jgi:hypothetical protein
MGIDTWMEGVPLTETEHRWVRILYRIVSFVASVLQEEFPFLGRRRES